MKQCWSEGELRAYLDCELPAHDMEALQAHVQECSACGQLCRELSARKDRLAILFADLPQPEEVRELPALPRRSRPVWAWVAAAAAIAMVFAWTPKRAVEQQVTRTPVPVMPATPVLQPPPVKPAIIRREPRKPATRAKPKPKLDQFVALDHEPIETGVIVRVGLGTGEIPADVIVGPDGRARAIRLVSDQTGEPK